jgi:hypothetical protein
MTQKVKSEQAKLRKEMEEKKHVQKWKPQKKQRNDYDDRNHNPQSSTRKTKILLDT